MPESLQHSLIIAYMLPAIGLMLFGLNLYVLTFLFLRKKKKNLAVSNQDFSGIEEWPDVLTQVPIYNEYNVIERCLRACAEMEYPEGKHTIQVLDDSTDATSELVKRIAAELNEHGHRIEIIQREDRTGFKAGAMDHALNLNTAAYIAIFDADFVPPKDFLKRTVSTLLKQPELGLVQARWGHLNPDESLLTRAQAMGIDGHFAIEQPARAWNDLFMNFNGTAGLWRRQAIEDAGGWQHDTLTEDMDLSYRSQLAGWPCAFLWDLEAPAELPNDIIAFKSQQFRWAKGSIETAIKLLPRVCKAKDKSLFSKVQSVAHMTHYMIHPFMVWMALLALPVVQFTWLNKFPVEMSTIFCAILIGTIAPTFMYSIAQQHLYPKGWKRIVIIPFLSCIGIGIAISNTRAVFEALIGKKSAFIRTPKKGENNTMSYKVKMPVLPILEIALGIYSFYTFFFYMQNDRILLLPFMFIYACGFSLVGIMSLHQTLKGKIPTIRRRKKTMPAFEPQKA